MIDKFKENAKDYKAVFSSEAGERVYEDIMHECCMDSPAHDIGNANRTFILGGKRAVGLYIKKLRDYKEKKKVEKKANGVDAPIM